MAQMPTEDQTLALANAMWQLLDDMGASGLSVCLAAKAQARIAYEPFRVFEEVALGEEIPCDYPLSAAEKIAAEISGLMEQMHQRDGGCHRR